MPNVGRPSQDCHTCRRRRIRCDLVRPGCGQCLRKGLRCGGYRDKHYGLFNVATTNSFRSTSGRYRRKTKKPNEDFVKEEWPRLEAGLEAGATNALITARQTKSSHKPQYQFIRLWTPVSEPWDEHVIPLAVNKFSFPCSIFSTVQSVLSRAKEGSALYQAAYAVGCAYLSTMDRSKIAVVRRTKAYTAAISTMNLVIRNATQATHDSTLLGVWLLGVYELLVATPDKTSRMCDWDSHNHGLIQLIRLRGLEQFRRQDGRNLFCVVFNNLHCRVLVPDQEYFEEAMIWFQEIYRHCAPWEYPLLRAYIYSYQCTRLCRWIGDILAYPTNHHDIYSTTASILEAVDALETEVDYPFPPTLTMDWTIKSPMETYETVNCHYIGTYLLQTNHRWRVSCHLQALLKHVSQGAEITPQALKVFQDRLSGCTEEAQLLKEKVKIFPDYIDDDRFRVLAKLGADIFLHSPLVSEESLVTTMEIGHET